jgi:serine protease Do
VFDAYGKVVGIVTMRLGNEFEGISFVIPSDGAAPILYDMMDGTEITNERRSPIASYAAKIGITCESYINGNRIGVRITEFSSDDYDAAKKLKEGDIIVSIGSDTVASAQELSDTVKKYDPGDSVEITVYRADQLLTFIIILGA